MVISDVHGDEFQDAVLRDDGGHHGALGIRVVGDERDTAGARDKLLAKGIVKDSFGRSADRFRGFHVEDAFNFCGR